MGFVSSIMTKEEALALPVEQRPLCYRLPEELYVAIWEAVGSASMCWKPDTGHAVFDTEVASEIATKLCFKVSEHLERQSGKT